MVVWLLNRVADLLIALMLVAVVLWFLLTQPVLPSSDVAVVDLGLKKPQLEQGLRELMALKPGETDQLQVTVTHVKKQLEAFGPVEVVDRGDDLRIMRIRLGKYAGRRMFVGVHAVVTDKPLLETSETVLSFVTLAKLLAQPQDKQVQLDLNIFFHRHSVLADNLVTAGVFHADQLSQIMKPQDIALILAPGLRMPGAMYKSPQWQYFEYLLPSREKDLAIFSRLRDVAKVREVKAAFSQAGLGSVGSISVPAGFPDMLPSPLNLYWERDLPVFMVEPGILYRDRDFSGHMAFIAAFYHFLTAAE